MVSLATLSVAGLTLGAETKPEDSARREKLSLAMRVSPVISFAPARVSATAELKGDPAPADEANLYCPAIEWDWGDGTRSESEYDCEPYEEGKSMLRRRFSAQHTYTTGGQYRVHLRLKRNERIVIATNSNIQVRPGAREWGM
jgi:hypothetical protein